LSQPYVPRRGTHRQIPAAIDAKAVKQLLTTHVLIACGDVALADVELARPAGDGVFVEADALVLAAEQMPGTGAATKGIDLVPRHVSPPTADEVPRRAASPPTQQGK